jgi:hypothetical protein
VHGDGAFGFVEKDALNSSAEAQQAFEIANQRLDLARTELGVPMNCPQNADRCFLLNGAHLRRHIGG